MPKTSPLCIKYQENLKAAIRLRARGVAYSEIIEELPHWKSISACQKAVAAALSCDFDNTVEAARNEIICRNEARIFKLMDKFEKNASVIVSREITKIDDQTAKLKGLFAPTKITETDSKGKDVPRSITVNVIKSTSLLKTDLPADSIPLDEPGN